MGKLRTLSAITVVLATLPTALIAQDRGSVAGRVTDQATGRPLSAAQVAVQGTTRRVVTNAQGQYSIANVPSGTYTITASLLGTGGATQRVTITSGQTATANFSLVQSAVALQGITVNAITGREERNVEAGTNVASINVAEIQKGPITKFADVLTGRTAGVSLQGAAGTTGTSQRIRIRGANSLSLSNEPLIYVDGVLFSNSKGGIGVGGQDYSRLNDLSPEDIENVQVLKGPAASALYGTAAANGVLLITTKRGKAGSARWNGYVEAGRLEDMTDYPSTFLAYQVNDPNAPLVTAAGNLNTGTAAQTAARTGPYVACPNLLAGTRNAAGVAACRQDAVSEFSLLEDPRTSPFSQGDRTKYGLNVSGGSEAVRYFLSGDRETENGVVDINGIEKINLRANVTAQLSDKINVQVTSGYINSDLNLISGDNNIFSPLINGLLASPFYIEGQDTLRSPGLRPGLGFGYSIGDIGQIITNQDVDRFIVGANTTYRPFTWLSGNVNVGMDYFNRNDFETLQPGRLPIGSPYTEGYRQSVRSNSFVYTGNTSAVATFDVSDALVATSTLGGAYNRELFENTSCFGAGIVEGTSSCSATSSQFSVGESFSEVITLGGFFQQQLAFRDRIFLAASIRGDNNSAFGSDFGFIYYPSASASWVVSDEPFFPEQASFLSNLRLRAAVGTSGLRPNFRDAITLLAPVSVQSGGQEQSAVTLSRTGNVNLKPERTREFEFGGDLGLFDDRLSADFTYFNKKSDDALISQNLAPSFGLTQTVFNNLGSVRNSGTELGLNARLLERTNTRLSLRVSATTLKNEIEELGPGIAPIIFNRGAQRHQQGSPTGAFYQRPYKYNDANGDGKLTQSEVTFDTTRFTVRQRTNLEGETVTDTIAEVFLGTALPTNTQSVSGELTLFKHFTITTLFDRRAGSRQLNDTERFRCSTGFGRSVRGNCAAVGDPNASLDEQARFVAARFLGTTAGFIEDATFVKWRELSLTVGVPEAVSNRFRALNGASFTLSGRNLKTWTDYTGLDPEINETGGGSNFTQGEFNTQPPVRYLTARFNFTF